MLCLDTVRDLRAIWRLYNEVYLLQRCLVLVLVLWLLFYLVYNVSSLLSNNDIFGNRLQIKSALVGSPNVSIQTLQTLILTTRILNCAASMHLISTAIYVLQRFVMQMLFDLFDICSCTADDDQLWRVISWFYAFDSPQVNVNSCKYMTTRSNNYLKLVSNTYFGMHAIYAFCRIWQSYIPFPVLSCEVMSMMLLV